jgi:hypothetical protein
MTGANPRGREVFDKWLKDMEVLKHKAEFAAFKVRDGRGETWKEMDFDGPRMLFGKHRSGAHSILMRMVKRLPSSGVQSSSLDMSKTKSGRFPRSASQTYLCNAD